MINDEYDFVRVQYDELLGGVAPEIFVAEEGSFRFDVLITKIGVNHFHWDIAVEEYILKRR